MKFLSLDVETANADMASICQIGIVEFDGQTVASSWGTLVNPEDYFDPTNIYVHGITPERVVGAPTFDQIHPTLQARLQNHIVVTHTPFDRTSLRQACKKHNTPLLECKWMDSATVVRNHWQQFSQSGFGLVNITSHLGIQYQPHDAVEDARAAGLVLLAAINESGLSLEDWHTRVQPQPRYSPKVAMSGNPEGPLYGENIVFTGELSISRIEAAQIAAEAGCNVQPGLTRQTTLLVVGIQDRTRLAAGQNKSSKHRKAEQLIQQGQPMRIITEKDFFDMVGFEPEDDYGDDEDGGLVIEFVIRP